MARVCNLSHMSGHGEAAARGCGIKESMFTCEGQIKRAERFEGEGPTGWRRLQRVCHIQRELGVGRAQRQGWRQDSLGCWDSPMDPLEATQVLITPTVASLRRQPSLRD